MKKPKHSIIIEVIEYLIALVNTAKEDRVGDENKIVKISSKFNQCFIQASSKLPGHLSLS